MVPCHIHSGMTCKTDLKVLAQADFIPSSNKTLEKFSKAKEKNLASLFKFAWLKHWNSNLFSKAYLQTKNDLNTLNTSDLSCS